MTDKHLSDQLLSQFDLHPDILKSLKEANFEYATPIQALTLPLALQGKDVAGQAQTGTGKTAAFLLAAFQHLLHEEKTANTDDSSVLTDTTTVDADTSVADDDKSDAKNTEKAARADKHSNKKNARNKNPIQSLILAPTRELAIQIHKDAELLGKHTGLKFALAYGGTGYDEQRETIEKGVDILIGTPGRIIDYFKQHVFSLDEVKVAVIDEADRMFDLGFIKDIRYLLRRMPQPEDRLNLLFSATMSYRVDELAYEHMNAPEKVEVEAERVVERIEERAYFPAQDEKISLLINLLNSEERKRTLVFVNTKFEATKIADWLIANDFKTSTLSGDVPQAKREKLLKSFQEGKTDILVATDVAARGLHIPDVSHVYNYDLPQDAEDYVHRSGRTARAGASGHAISLVCEKYAYGLMDIEEYIGHSLPVEKISPELVTQPENRPKPRADRDERPARGRGARPSSGRTGGTRQFNDDRAGQRRGSSGGGSAYDDDRPPSKRQQELKEARAKLPPPREIEFIPPPAEASKRFGEIPLLG